MTVTLNKQAK